MEVWVKAAWLLLVAVHATPAVAAFRPSLVSRLYGFPATGDLGVLLVHRGWLFLAVVAVAALAAFEPHARRAATLVLAISVLGFLITYGSAGCPRGPLRKIALADALAVPALALAGYDAWLGGGHGLPGGPGG